MFAHPVIVLAALGLIGGFDPLWISVAVLMAALPTAASVYVFAEQYDAWLEGASSSILVTTLVSAVTVPALLYVIEQGLLPYGLVQLVRRYAAASEPSPSSAWLGPESWPLASGSRSTNSMTAMGAESP
jgi:hypothetical protein